MRFWPWRRARPGITVFHVTHPKAGSQWVYAVLKYLQPHRIVVPKVGVAQVLEEPLRPGAVYPTVYLSRDRFEALAIPQPARVFVVIRDLRDTLVSLYFSLRYSHPLLTPQHAEMRQRLEGSSPKEGMRWLMDDALPRTAAIQESWLGHPSARLIRYEDLLADEYGAFLEIARFCEFPKTPGNVRQVVKDSTFQALSGRARGEEDVHAHLRKAVPGDWRHHLDADLQRELKQRFGETLVRTGYEKDLDW